MRRWRKFVFAFMFASVVLFGALGVARGGDYREGEALVVMKGMSGGVGLHTKASLESSAAHLANSTADSAGARVTTLHGYITQRSDKVFALVKSDTRTTEQLIDELKANPDVLAASPNRIVGILNNPLGYSADRQWGIDTINAPVAWNWDVSAPALSPKNHWGKRDISVVVIDTGIMSGHLGFLENGNPSLSNLDSKGFSRDYTKNSSGIEDENGHGTHVSGIIGAASGAGHLAVGVSPRVNLITLKVIEASGKGDLSNVILALKYVSDLITDGVNIKAVNLSLGWGYENAKSQADLLGTVEYIAFREFEAKLKENAPVIVVAAGNDEIEVGIPYSGELDEKSVSEYLTAPASFIGLRNLIVVGSIDSSGDASSFSNWSDEYVHLAAPGGRIYSTDNGNNQSYGFKNGTSMATPFVTGAVALLASKDGKAPGDYNLNISTEQLRRILFVAAGPNTSRPAGNGQLSLFGLLNVGKAMQMKNNDDKVTSIPARNVSIKIPSSIKTGDTFYAAAVIDPPHSTDSPENWRSSDPSVAIVDANGLVRVIAPGRVTISASVGGQIYSIAADTRGYNKSYGEGGSGCSADQSYSYLLVLFAFVTFCARRSAKGA